MEVNGRAPELQEQLDIEAALDELEGFDDWDVFADPTDDEEDAA